MNALIIFGILVTCTIVISGLSVAIIRALSRPRSRIPAPVPAHSQQKPKEQRPSALLPYTRIPQLLTAAESDFFTALQSAAPSNVLIFAQVRLANLVQVQPWARHNKTHWYKIQAKCVDFVLCEPHTFEPRLVIELDDRSHDRHDRRERDAFVDAVMESAGVPILHVRWRPSYDSAALAAQIQQKLQPIQPAMAGTPPQVRDTAWAVSRSNAPPAEAFWKPIPDTASVATVPAVTLPTSMRYVCGQCQSEIRQGAKFCTQCGTIFSIV